MFNNSKNHHSYVVKTGRKKEDWFESKPAMQIIVATSKSWKTQADIHRLTKVTKPRISELMPELVEAGILKEKKKTETRLEYQLDTDNLFDFLVKNEEKDMKSQEQKKRFAKIKKTKLFRDLFKFYMEQASKDFYDMLTTAKTTKYGGVPLQAQLLFHGFFVAILLFDNQDILSEIEKQLPKNRKHEVKDILNYFLEEIKVTDNKGKRIDIKSLID